MLPHRGLHRLRPFLSWRYPLPSSQIAFATRVVKNKQVSAERVTLEANLQRKFRERELLLRDELVELHFAHYMSQQARQELQAWEAQQKSCTRLASELWNMSCISTLPKHNSIKRPCLSGTLGICKVSSRDLKQPIERQSGKKLGCLPKVCARNSTIT